MRFEKTMVLIGAERRAGFKNPSEMVQQILVADGMDTVKFWATPEQYEFASKKDAYSPVLVTFSVNLTNGKTALLNLSDVPAVGHDASTGKSGKTGNDS